MTVESGPDIAAGRPQLVFEGPYDPDPNLVGLPNYDVSPDGSRFLMVQTDALAPASFTLVQNWHEELKRLVPLD